MKLKIKERIQRVFKEVEQEEPDKSTEYLFEITRQRLELEYRMHCDASDIAEALQP